MALPKDSYAQVKRYNSYNIEFNDVNLLALSQIFVFELSLNRLEGNGFLNRLKKYSLDNYVKAIISLFYNNGNKSANSRYLFVNDVFNNSMVENMRTVQKEFDEEFIELISDKRLMKEKSEFIFRYFNPISFIRQIFKTNRLLKQSSLTIRDLCNIFDIKKRLLILNIFDSIFVLNCAECYLNTHRDITRIILNTDVHKVSKAIVLLAAKRKIKTYVIQHGSTVLEYGYLPVISDYMFTWGKLSNDWFLSRGTDEKKLISTGTPKMDYITNFEIRDGSLKKADNILLILNPIGEKNIREFLGIVKEAKLDFNYNLVIKLHPGSIDNRNIVEEYFDKSKTKIYKNENTHQLIYDSDVVVTTTSTVGNEAIAFNKPLLQIKTSNIKSSMDYEKYDCSHTIQNAKELESLIGNIDKLESKKVNYQQFIPDYFYSLDGKSAYRIKKFIA
ncbi:MAG: hypothetical protein WBG90_14595 [Saonia sp.]